MRGRRVPSDAFQIMTYATNREYFLTSVKGSGQPSAKRRNRSPLLRAGRRSLKLKWLDDWLMVSVWCKVWNTAQAAVIWNTVCPGHRSREFGYLQRIFRNGVLEGRQISDILVMKPFHFEVQVHVLRALALSVFFMFCKKRKTRKIRWHVCATVHICCAKEACILILKLKLDFAHCLH